MKWLPAWSALKRLSTSWLIRSSHFWALFLPIFVGLFPKENRQWLERLPFSWQLWFCAACAFSIALIIYHLFCPRVVRDFDRFDDYRAEGRGGAHLLRALDHLAATSRSKHVEMVAVSFRRKYAPPPEGDLFGGTGREESGDVVIPPEAQSEAFWFIRDLSDCNSPVGRLACFGFCCMGFFFAAIIALENLVAVLKMTF
jgi:hypothetical protein